MDARRALRLHRALQRSAAEDDRDRARRARGRMLDGELDRLHRLLRLVHGRGVLGGAREEVPQIVVAVLAGARLVGRVVLEGRHVGESASSSIGDAPFTASRVPKSALQARKIPWPMTTPGLPVSRPYISAMIEPTCS